MTDVLRMQRQRIQTYGELTLGAKVCTDNPTDCCATQTPCYPTGTDGIRVEKRRIYLPDGWRLGEEWCELGMLCCDEAGGEVTGSGDCTECCEDVYPYYSVATACCADPLPQYFDLTISGDCDEIDGLYSMFQIFSAAYGGNVWIGQRGGAQPITSNVIVYCDGVTLKADIRCVDVGDTDPVDLTINLTITACCPFDASGSGTIPVEADCTCLSGSTVNLLLRAGAGSSDPGTGTADAGNCLVLLKKRRIYFPRARAEIGDPYCIDDPDACCEDLVTVGGGFGCPCPEIQIPRTLYATFDHAAGPPLGLTTHPLVYHDDVYLGVDYSVGNAHWVGFVPSDPLGPDCCPLFLPDVGTFFIGLVIVYKICDNGVGGSPPLIIRCLALQPTGNYVYSGVWLGGGEPLPCISTRPVYQEGVLTSDNPSCAFWPPNEFYVTITE